MYLFKSFSGKVGTGHLTFDPSGLSLVGGESLEQSNGQSEVIATQILVGGADLLQKAHQRN